MGRHIPKEMTVEEFDDWSNARKKLENVGAAADEVGGPRLSLVPLPEQNEAWPTDLLAPAAEPGDDASTALAEPPIDATPFDGIPLESSRKRLAGPLAAHP